jgi:pimeloyl-ACP methyl ester carboxylesterase
MRQIACPILLITGDVGAGSLVTPEEAQESANLWREGRVVRISGAGHVIHNDRYDQYIAAVRAFLAEVDA